MPTILDFQQARGSLPESPVSTDVNPERFGKDAAALSKLGGEIGDFGSRLITARKQATENDAVSTAQSDDVQWLAKEQQSLMLNYVKKDEAGNPVLDMNGEVTYDVEGFSDAFKQKTDERFKEQMKVMPTGDAQRMYESRVQPMFDSSYVKNLQWENTTRALTFKKNMDIRINQDANFLIENPSFENASNSIKALKEALDNSVGNVNTPGEAQDTYRRGAKTYIDALFRGYANNSSTAKEGLLLLNSISRGAPRDYKTGELIMEDQANYPKEGTAMGVNEQGQNVVSGGGMRKGQFGGDLDPLLIAKVMDPQDIDTMRTRLQNKIKDGEKDSASSVRALTRSYESLLKDNDPAALLRFRDPEARGLIVEYQRLAKTEGSGVSPEEANKAAMIVSLGKAHAMVRNEFWSMKPSEMAEYDKRLKMEFDAELKLLGVDSGVFGYEVLQEYDRVNQTMKKGVMDARRKDPAGYIEAHFSDSGKLSGGSIRGIPNASRIASRLSVARSLDMPGAVFTGQEASSLISQLKKLSDTDPNGAAKMLADIKSTTGQYADRAMDQISSRGGLDKSFMLAYQQASDQAAASVVSNFSKENREALYKSVPSDELKALKDKVAQEFKGTYSAFASVGQYAKNNKFAQSLQEAVTLEAINAHQTGGASWDEARAQAAEKIIGDNYHILGTAFVPKQLGSVMTNPKYIQGEMDSIHNSEAQKRMGLVPPGGALEKDADVLSRKLKLSVEQGRWVTKPSGAGARFMVPIGKGVWIPMTNKDKKPIDIDFAEASIKPSKEAIDSQKTIIERVMNRSPQSIPVEGNDLSPTPLLDAIKEEGRFVSDAFNENMNAEYEPKSKTMQWAREFDNKRKSKDK